MGFCTVTPAPDLPVAPPGGGGDARAPALAFLPQRRAPASPRHVPRGWKQPSAIPKSSFSQGYLPLESSLFSPKPSKKSNVSNSRELKRGADRGAGNGSPQRTPSAWAPPRHVKRHLSMCVRRETKRWLQKRSQRGQDHGTPGGRWATDGEVSTTEFGHRFSPRKAEMGHKTSTGLLSTYEALSTTLTPPPQEPSELRCCYVALLNKEGTEPRVKHK